MADMLERIAKLLAQAENAGTEAEAATFMEKAQTLATTYSVDLAKARHITKNKEKTLPVQRAVHIGEPRQRGLRTLVDLYLGIAAANDIRCTIAHNATRVYAVGFAEDLDVAEAVYASLVTQQAKFADEFRRTGDWRGEKVYVETYDRWGWKTGEWKNQTWVTARLNFQDAFASRIRTRLRQAQVAEEQRIKEAEQEAAKRPHLDADGIPTPEFNAWLSQNHGIDLSDLEDDTGTVIEFAEMLRDVDDAWTQEILAEYAAALEAQLDSAPGAALVLVEKRAAVDEVYAPILKRARGSYRGGTTGATSNSGRAAGAAAANRASIGRSTAIGGTRGAISA